MEGDEALQLVVRETKAGQMEVEVHHDVPDFGTKLAAAGATTSDEHTASGLVLDQYEDDVVSVVNGDYDAVNVDEDEVDPFADLCELAIDEVTAEEVQQCLAEV